MSADIPTQADFKLLPDKRTDPDHWSAWEHFGGLNLDEAYEVFRRNPLYYQEDLMWMAAKPFCFYLPIALRYLQSEESMEDGDLVSGLAVDIEHHFTNGQEISAAFPCIKAICEYILSHYSKFDVIEGIYGDLRPKYVALGKRVGQ